MASPIPGLRNAIPGPRRRWPRRHWQRVPLAVALAAAPLGTADAATHRVPADFVTIHEALAASAAGDTVRVAPGVWSATTTRTLQIDGVPTTYVAAGFVPRDVTLLSEGGPDVTSIEVADAGTNVRCLVTDPAAGAGVARIEGFTFRRTVSRGPAIVAHGTETSRLDVRDCNFLELHGETGPGGILVAKGSLTVTSATFDACSSLAVAGAIAHADTVAASASRRIDLTDCRFTRCYKGCVGGKRVELHMTGCDFERNYGPCARGGIAALEVGSCRFEDNIGRFYTALYWATSGSGHVRGCTLVHNGWSALYGGTTVVLEGFSGDVSQNTFLDNRGYSGYTACLGASAATQVRNNVFAGSRGGPAVAAPSSVSETCNIYWDNTSGDTSGLTRSPTSFTADPQFCDAAARDLTVRASSPCTPEYSAGCGSIGAHGVGCEAYLQQVLTEPPGLQVQVDSTVVYAPFGATWGPGEQHELRAITRQDNGTTRAWVFTTWSDGLPDSSRTIVTPDGPVSWTAQYMDEPRPEFTIRTLPLTSLRVRIDGTSFVAPETRYWHRGSAHVIEAQNPGASWFDGRWTFGSWSQGGDRIQTYVVPMAGLMFDLAATYVFEDYPLLTVTSDPPGRTVTISSLGSRVTPYSRPVQPGLTLTVSLVTTQTADFGGTEYRFREWSDGGAASHPFVMPSAPTTLTAYFDTVVHDGVILQANRSGLSLPLDGTPRMTPTFVPLVEGTNHVLVAPWLQLVAGQYYGFTGWSDASTDTARAFTQPQGHLSFSATYEPVVPPGVNLLTQPSGLSLRLDGTSRTTPVFVPLAAGTAHILIAPPFQLRAGQYYGFTNWSDASTDTARAFTQPGERLSFTAVYEAVVPPGVNLATQPPGLPLQLDGTSRTTPVFVPLIQGTNHVVIAPSIQFTTHYRYEFAAWSDASTDTARFFTQPDEGLSFTATYNSSSLADVTLLTEPAGLPVVGDNQQRTSPFTFSWTIGTYHAIAALDPIFQQGIRLGWKNWSDGGAMYHVIQVPAQGLVLSAAYDTTYQLSMSADPVGTVVPGDTYVRLGDPLEIEAIAEPGYYFREWTGTGPGSYSGGMNPTTIIPGGPVAEVAHFERAACEFALSLSRDDPNVHTGAPLGVGPVYLWFVCGSGRGFYGFEGRAAGTMTVFGFTPEPGVINVGAAPDALLLLDECPDTPQILGTWFVSDPSGGTLCLVPSMATGRLRATDCSPAPGLAFAWPEDMRVRGISTSADPFCELGRACVEGGNPVAVRVPTFAAVERDGGVDVRWTTETPDAAFRVLRKGDEESAYRPLHASPLQGESAYLYRDDTVLPGARYWYMLSATESDGTETRIGPTLVTMKALPERFSFGAVEPNPILDHAVLRFATTRPGRVRVDAFDVAGRRVAAVMDGILPAGEHTAAWDGRGTNGRRLAAGVYFLRLQAAERTETRRVVVLGD